MTDVHDTQIRSRNMRAIRSKNTKPELTIRRLLHGAGFRFRLHRKDLPGSPDLVLPRHKVVIFVHGCFWHGHECHLFKVPKTRSAFWIDKIAANRVRDRESTEHLLAAGWRVLTIWECALKGSRRRSNDELIQSMLGWFASSWNSGTIGS